MDSSKINHSIQLTLSDNDIREYKLRKSSDGKSVSGNIKLDDLISVINRRTQGSEILAKNYFSSCAVEIEAERRLDEIKNSKDSTSIDGSSTIASSSNSARIYTGLNVDGNGSSDTHKDVLKQTANELIKEKVSIEMEHLTSPELS